MTTFENFISTLKGFLAGFFPVGGTMVPVSETFPVAMAQHIMGGFATYPDNQSLAGIPYQNLQIDMEVIVSAHNDGLNNNFRTRWRLKAMPSSNTRVIDIPGYLLTDYWEVVTVYDGAPPAVIPGPPGDKGWAPLIMTETDGADRVVLKIIGYIGGQGTAPSLPISTLRYLGSTGFTTKSLAINVKGLPGPPGATPSVPVPFYDLTGSKRTTPPTTSWVDAQGNFIYVCNSFSVTNTYFDARWFVIEGEVPVSNDSGSDSWAVMLLNRPNSSWPGDQAGITSQIRLDANYSRMDFVNAAPFPSVHKIRVRATILILGGQTQYFRLVLTQTNGGSSKYSSGMLEAYGV